MNITEQLNDQKRRVDFNTYDISVKELISMVSESIIDIAPEYQRQFRWPADKQSALIESIFLGIPVPSLFMATNPDGTWELIDGVQRLSSMIHFAGSDIGLQKIGLPDSLKLTRLDKLTALNNKIFSELPNTVQLEFLLKPIKITTLSDKSDLEVRFDLFERLNTGGIELTDQEIRSCVYRGRFNDFIQELAKDENYNSVVRLTKTQENDGTRQEFVLRFFAFLNNYQNFEHSVVEFLNEYMAAASKNFNYRQAEDVFKETFRQLAAIPDGITRGRKNTPTNLYEGVAVGAALVIQQGQALNVNNAAEWITGDALKGFTTGATNSRLKVESRINYCRDQFLA